MRLFGRMSCYRPLTAETSVRTLNLHRTSVALNLDEIEVTRSGDEQSVRELPRSHQGRRSGRRGTNAVSRMVDAGVTGVEFIAVNTDAQSLQMGDADVKIHIGSQAHVGSARAPTRHRPGGGPGVARRAEAEPLKGADIHHRGRGRGHRHRCGADPGRAREGGARRPHRRGRDEARLRGPPAVGARGGRHPGAPRARRHADRDRERPPLQVVEKKTSVVEAFRADDVLRQGVQGITDLITVPGLVNLDFADVRTIMTDAGSALMGIGTASARTAPPKPRAPPSPRRCSRRRSRARPASSSTCPAPRTSASSR